MKFSQTLPAALVALALSHNSYAFDSGSTGVDGAFNPGSDIELPLPPSGIFNFTTVNIPSGVTVTFGKNAANTPVTILAIGDITIDGTISVNGGNSPATNDTDKTDDSLPGIGGPGGYDGGRGGYYATADAANNDATNGLGLGGGVRSTGHTGSGGLAGGGGGYGTSGGSPSGSGAGTGGGSYGNTILIPLLGGSGGAGGSGGHNEFGSGGGGGGGALLLASSATVNINGSISASGGNSGNTTTICSSAYGSVGGGGSGGGIRIVATTIQGEGSISALGGVFGSRCTHYSGASGGVGRIHLAADNMLYFKQTSPTFNFSAPNPVFISNLPSIQITSVGGIAAPATPTGVNDVVLPQNTPNPVDIVFATTDVPEGSVIQLTATPSVGGSVVANSGPTAADGTATVSIDLPNGPSTLLATTTFIVTAALSDAYSQYAQGEKVEKVRLAMGSDGNSSTTLITANGNEYQVPSNIAAM